MMKYTGQNGVIRFLKSNGVYVALVVSLLAVGAVVAGTFGKSLLPQTEEPQEEMVEQVVTNQPDTRTTTESVSTTGTTTETVAEEAPASYVFPLSNTVQKIYSAEEPLYSVTLQDWRLHPGTDFAGNEGQKVRAMAQGEVTDIVEDPLWGTIITIDHGVGVVSKYCGVEATVKKGERVEAADQIGTLSTIPCEAGQPAHLHLELWVEGKPIDPVPIIGLDVRYADALE